MLAQLEKPTNDFHALARYLIDGREQPPNPRRVAWVMPHNLGTDAPLLAAKLMAATAEMSKRCKHACYHAMIAWREDERPTPEVMQEIARKTLTLAGLGEHQALVVGHGDKAHPHLHMMINRVHPDTGRAWSTSNDYRKFDRIMQQLSEEHGFTYVPPHSFHPELTDDRPKRPNSRATFAARRGAFTARPQWSNAQARAYGRQLSEKLDMASTWEDVESVLAEDGLQIEEKGRGLVVGNTSSYAKLSALRLGSTAKALGRMRVAATAPSSSKSRHWWDINEVDIARAIGSEDDYKAALRRARGARRARLEKQGLAAQIEEELRETLKELG